VLDTVLIGWRNASLTKFHENFPQLPGLERSASGIFTLTAGAG
jgi:hypothetical protein